MEILVVSNMYPSRKYPNYGVFVKNFITICEENNINVKKIGLSKQDYLIKRGFHYFFYFLMIFVQVLFKKYDFIYVHYAGQNAFPILFLSKLKKLNIILNVHGSDIVPEKKIHEYLLIFTKMLLRRCDKIVVPSEYYKELVTRKFDIKTNNLYVFPSAGIDSNIFFPIDKNNARSNINISLNKKTIGFISRLDYGKGWDTLLNAIKIMIDNKTINYNDYQFIIVGDGKEATQFEETIKKNKLEKYIIHYQLIDQKKLNNFYNSFDCFCFPTRRESESLGLVALEALACGVPVISADFAAPKFYIKENYNGLKFTVNSPNDLAIKIENFFNTPQETIEVMKINSIRSSEKFNKELVKDILITDILGEKNVN